jgi:hypothetical protein
MVDSSLAKLTNPIHVKIAAVYLIFTGLLGVIWYLFDIGPFVWKMFGLHAQHPEFEALGPLTKITIYVRSVVVDSLFLISGIGIFLRKRWAKKLGLVMIAISSYYFTRNFARGLAGGKPDVLILFLSAGISFIWHGIFFYLLLDHGKTKEEMGSNLYP